MIIPRSRIHVVIDSKRVYSVSRHRSSGLQWMGGRLVEWVRSVMGLALVAMLTSGCSSPLYIWEAHITSTPTPPSFDVAALGREPVATLPPATYNHLQGYVPSVSQALSVACSEVSPLIRAISQYEAVNKLNRSGVAGEYAEKDPTFAASRTLDRQRLRQMGEALGVRYVLQPGLASFSEDLDDKFELFGVHIIKTRFNTMLLWLRLWDAQTGDMLWEAAGEATVAAELLNEGAAVPFHEIARKLWRRMIQENLLHGKVKSRSFLEGRIFEDEIMLPKAE